jgi:hypothetical protein
VPRKPTSGGKRTRTPPSRSGLVSSLTEKPAITRLLCCGVEDSGGNTCHMRFISVYIPKVKSVYIVSKLVCILLAKWCVGIGDPTDTWVGRTKEWEIEPLHVWGAVLMWTKGIPGKYLFIYDSNSDRLSRDEEVTGKKLLGKQQALHKGVA